MSFSISSLLENHHTEKFELHEKHLNNQMVKVLKPLATIATTKKP